MNIAGVSELTAVEVAPDEAIADGRSVEVTAGADVDLTWVPESGAGDGVIAEYYEAESWQFSGCGD